MNKTLILQEAAAENSIFMISSFAPTTYLRKLIRAGLFATVSLVFVIGTTGCGRKGALTLPKPAQSIVLKLSV